MMGRLDYTERLRQHSVGYNGFLWKLAVKVGMVLPDADVAVLQPSEVQDAVIHRLDVQHALLAASLGALRAVRSDRPSVHSDHVWLAVNGVIEEIERYQADQPSAAPS